MMGGMWGRGRGTTGWARADGDMQGAAECERAARCLATMMTAYQPLLRFAEGAGLR